MRRVEAESRTLARVGGRVRKGPCAHLSQLAVKATGLAICTTMQLSTTSPRCRPMTEVVSVGCRRLEQRKGPDLLCSRGRRRATYGRVELPLQQSIVRVGSALLLSFEVLLQVKSSTVEVKSSFRGVCGRRSLSLARNPQQKQRSPAVLHLLAWCPGLLLLLSTPAADAPPSQSDAGARSVSQYRSGSA